MHDCFRNGVSSDFTLGDLDLPGHSNYRETGYAKMQLEIIHVEDFQKIALIKDSLAYKQGAVRRLGEGERKLACVPGRSWAPGEEGASLGWRNVLEWVSPGTSCSLRAG